MQAIASVERLWDGIIPARRNGWQRHTLNRQMIACRAMLLDRLDRVAEHLERTTRGWQ